MRLVGAGRGRKTWLPAAALAALAAFAWAGAAMNVTSGTIGTNVAFSAFGFDPGTKAPKASLVPVGGGKAVKMKVFDFDPTRIDAQVVKGVVGDYSIVLTSADKAVAPVTVDGTFTIVPPAPASVEPATGPVKIPVAILGDSFGVAKGKVTIGGRNAKVTRWANDRIEVVVPKKLAAGAQPIVVTGKAGASVAPLSFTVTEDGGAGDGEFMRLDVGTIHLEQTARSQFYFGATHNVSQGFAGVSVSKPPSANPGFIMNINGPAFATPTPYDVTPTPSATGTLTVTFSDGAGSVYTALPSSDFRFTITSYSGGILAGTFGGTLSKLAGNGPATVVVTNGEVRAELTIVGQ
jgi:IPT/TIG domain